MEREQQEKLQIIGTDGRILSDDQGVKVMREMLSELWGGCNDNFEKPIVVSTGNPPTLEEVQAAIASLKVETASGRNRVCSKSIKSNNEAALHYQQILKEIWTTEEIPKQ